MKSLIIYSTVLGGFYSQNDAFMHAVTAARYEAGDEIWNRGYSGQDPRGATRIAQKHFQADCVNPIVPEGALENVRFNVNRDAVGNTYPKLWVTMYSQCGEEMLLSLDLKSDVAQRLIGKIDSCLPGQVIKVSAWPARIVRDGRTFINHAVSVKDQSSKEIPANSNFSANVKTICDQVEVTLKSAGIVDKRLIATAKAAKRVDCFKEKLIQIQNNFNYSMENTH